MAVSLGQRTSNVLGGILKGRAGAGVRAGLDVLGIGGVALGGLLPVGENMNWDADPLLDSAFAIRVNNFPSMQEGDVNGVNLQLPSMTYKSQRVQGNMHYYPDHPEVSDLTIGFNETSYLKILGYYRTVMKAIYDESSGTYGIPADYKTDIEVDIMFYDGSPIVTVVHKNCSLANIAQYGMSNAGNKAITPTLTYKVERIEISAIDDAATGGGIVDEILRGMGDIIGISVKDKIGNVLRGF